MIIHSEGDSGKTLSFLVSEKNIFRNSKISIDKVKQ